MANNIAYLKDIYDSHDYTVPRIHVSNQTQIVKKHPGKAGIVAIIGAFPNNSREIRSYTSYKTLLRDYGIEPGTSIEKYFDGLCSAKYILNDARADVGATEILVCNITDYTEKGNKAKDSIIKWDKDTDAWYAEINTYAHYSTPADQEIGDGEEPPLVSDEDKANFKPEEYYDTKLTFEKLQKALNQLYGEIFDLLFVADTFENIVGAKHTVGDKEEEYDITAPYIECEEFLSSEFQLQRPSQLVAPLVAKYPNENGPNTSSIYNESKSICPEVAQKVAEVFEKSVFNFGYLNMQQLYLHTESVKLSLIESTAYICGYMAGLNVGQPLTFQTIPGVCGVDEELYVGPNDAGYKLTQMGLPIIVNKIRKTREYCVLNSMTPSGYDIAQIRSVSYLIKQYDLQKYLGMTNSDSVRSKIAVDMNVVNQRVMSEVNIIDSIDSDNIIVPTLEDGTKLPHELYIELNVVVHGVLILIDLGVNMTEGESE